MDIQAALQQYLNDATVTNLDRLDGGWETDVYRFDADGRPLVARVYTAGDFGGRATTEALVLRRLHALGYPVPEVVAFESDPALMGAPFLLMERIDGKPLGRFYSSPAQMGAIFVSLLVQLHAVDAKAVADQILSTFALDNLDHLLHHAGMAEPFADLLAELRRREAQVEPWAPVLIHGDFHPQNILMTPDGRPAVIDWSAATLADPRIDVAMTTVLSATTGSPEEAKAFRAGYEAMIGRPLPDMEYFELLCLARRLMVMVITFVKGPGALGMKPGIERFFQGMIPYMRGLTEGVEQMSGVPLPLVRELLR